MIKLTPRLKAVADMIGECECFLDIGTDHAYLPAYIVENKISSRAIASDINPNPLKNAEKTLIQYDLTDKIELRLSAGFDKIQPFEAQEISIAGMGGIMIADMIENTPWLKDKSVHLVLQPMTHFENVRQALFSNGFEIIEEKTVAEDRHIYVIMSAVYTGNTASRELYEYYTGALAHSDGETDKLFVLKVLNSLNKKYNGSGDEKTLEIIRSIENAQGKGNI